MQPVLLLPLAGEAKVVQHLLWACLPTGRPNKKGLLLRIDRTLPTGVSLR
jgi:hypothetical protein